ncbi:MAG: PepSY domain-containing protein [Aliihoeflea sp.]|uniref:PepSY domain-containing protein n=1 Tax=Aliihoeflea sp. TaxID=2608088 RepID=UPI0040341EE6
MAFTDPTEEFLMKLQLAAASLLIAAGLSLPALAQPAPGSIPLSEILATIEAEDGFGYFDEIEWDSDGYWEIEYYRADGAKIDIDIDPASGQPR